jgi:hypothetical protein
VLVGIVDELLHHVWVDTLGDVEQVVSVALPAFALFVWEVLGHIWKAHKLGVQSLYGDLVVLLDGDHLDRAELHQALLPGEDILDEVFGAHLV